MVHKTSKTMTIIYVTHHNVEESIKFILSIYSLGPCYYAGDSQGGRTSEREENESVIEGYYTDYEVDGLFSDEFVYSQFEKDRCLQTV